MRAILGHAVALAGLYLTLSFALFLGLRLNPLAGNIGLAATVVLVGLYVYFGIVKRRLKGLLLLLAVLVLVEVGVLAVLDGTV